MKNLAGDGGDFRNQDLQKGLCVGLPGKVCALSGPKLEELRLHSFLRKGNKIFYERTLQWIGKSFYTWAIELFEQLVVDSAG
jgi:hypothetical protein